MSLLTEDAIEQNLIELLQKQGYAYAQGSGWGIGGHHEGIGGHHTYLRVLSCYLLKIDMVSLFPDFRE